MAFDENIGPDVLAVLKTSALLEITEFEVFRIAYRDWFGRRVADNIIEPFYTDYMFNEVVPAWVRLGCSVVPLYDSRYDRTKRYTSLLTEGGESSIPGFAPLRASIWIYATRLS